MMKINPWDTLCRNAETGDGSGASGGGETGTVAGDGAAVVVAGSEPAAPATTFLTEAGKVAEAAPAEGEAKVAEGEAPPSEAPATFDIAAVTLPEGTTLDEETGKSFSDILGNTELSAQDRGQQLLDLHVKALETAQKTAVDAWTEASKKHYDETNAKWLAEIKELPEFKANPEAEGGKVMQVLKGLGAGEDFFTALNVTGAGNNPAILQVLHRLAQPLMEGAAVSGQGKPASAKRLGDNMYTSTNKPS